MYFSVGRFEPCISMALRSTRSEILGADILLNSVTNAPHINVGDLNVSLSCVRRNNLLWGNVSSPCLVTRVLSRFSYSYRLEL